MQPLRGREIELATLADLCALDVTSCSAVNIAQATTKSKAWRCDLTFDSALHPRVDASQFAEKTGVEVPELAAEAFSARYDDEYDEDLLVVVGDYHNRVCCSQAWIHAGEHDALGVRVAHAGSPALGTRCGVFGMAPDAYLIISDLLGMTAAVISFVL